MEQPNGDQAPDAGFRSSYNQAAVNKRLSTRVGDLTFQVDALTQALQESQVREMEQKQIIDELMTKLRSYTEDNKEEDEDGKT